jgi:hypothetical protein
VQDWFGECGGGGVSAVKPVGRKVEVEEASLSVEEEGLVVVEQVAEKEKRKNE